MSEVIKSHLQIFKAEFFKMRLLKVPLFTVIITGGTFALTFLIYYSMTSNLKLQGPDGKPTGLNPADNYWATWHFFMRYLFPMLVALITTHHIAREFEWKTIHQAALKGIKATEYVFGKILSFTLITFMVYLLLAVVAIVFYMFVDGGGASVALANVKYDIISSDFLFAFMAIPVATLLALLMASASISVILSLVYFLIVESVVINMAVYLLTAVKKEVAAKIVSHFPMYIPQKIQTDHEIWEVLVYILVYILWYGLFSYLSVRSLTHRELALVK